MHVYSVLSVGKTSAGTSFSIFLFFSFLESGGKKNENLL